jgi:hypothetical protein
MRASFSMFSRWISLSGASRTQSTRRRRSFSVTSAARWTRFSLKPLAMAASVLALQGAMIIPSVRNEPLEIAAPMSAGGYATVASASARWRENGVSWLSVRAPQRLMTRCVSTPVSRNRSSTRTP